MGRSLARAGFAPHHGLIHKRRFSLPCAETRSLGAHASVCPPKNLDASQDESSVAFGNRGSGVKESVTAFPHAE